MYSMEESTNKAKGRSSISEADKGIRMSIRFLLKILFCALLIFVVGAITEITTTGSYSYELKEYPPADITKNSHAIVKLNDGFLIVGSVFDDSGPSSWGWIIKTDRNGNKLWEKELGRKAKDSAFYAGVETKDGIVLVGRVNAVSTGTLETSKGWIVKLNHKGKVVWDKNISLGRTTFLNGVTITDNNEIIIVGGSRSTIWTDPSLKETAILLKYDMDGNQIFKKTLIKNTKNTWGNFIKELPNHELFITGDYKDPFDGTTSPWATITESNGTIKWEFVGDKGMKISASDTFDSKTNTLIIAGSCESEPPKGAWFSLLSANGKLLSTTKLRYANICSVADVSNGYIAGHSCNNNSLIVGYADNKEDFKVVETVTLRKRLFLEKIQIQDKSSWFGVGYIKDNGEDKLAIIKH